uniref:Uncharacterized protein n=1 Tax=Anguilla anguilla TaxID=7936 RepID=A0A0E9TNL3_ANGAN
MVCTSSGTIKRK